MSFKKINVEITEVTCDKCKYVWQSRTMCRTISCPKCACKCKLFVDENIAKYVEPINLDEHK
jgi:hypothetical protein